MGLHLMSLTASGGLPLFSRKIGAVESLPFSTMASLNGVHMFCNSHGCELKNVYTEDTTVVWKTLEDSITLIAVGVCTQESVLNELLDFAFGALVMIVGLEEIRMHRSAERLKRDLRISYPVLDRLMECIDLGNQSLSSSDILSLVPVVFTPENSLLLNCLEVWTEVINSQFGCVVVENSIAAATSAWWELDAHERKLLQLLIMSSGGVTATDIPVFLPQRSPTVREVPFRLVSCMLVSGVWVSALCGPAPSLSQIERLTAECWKHVTEVLKSVSSIVPRNFPQSIILQQGIIGFLLINIPLSKYVMSNTVSNNKKESRSNCDVLRTFFYESATSLTSPHGEHAALETYWCSEYHKIYAMRIEDEIMCVLFSSNIPTPTMRILTRETHALLTGDKHFCW
nr:PREDICTED: protein fuzzy homolog isoform X1 [Bemisia tabaci]